MLSYNRDKLLEKVETIIMTNSIKVSTMRDFIEKIEDRKLVDFLSSKKSSEKFAKSGLIVPARRDVAESVCFLDNKKPLHARVFLDVIKTSKPTPVSVDYKEILDNLKGKFEYLFN